MAVDALPSLLESRDLDPYPIYAGLRRQGSVVRDEGMGAWLVLDHPGCAFVERREDLFEEPTSGLPGATAISGRRDLRALVGDEHDALYRAISHAWRPVPIERYRASVIRPILAERLAALGQGGRMEVFGDLATRVPIRIIARILGLPADDEEALRRAKGWLEAVLAWRHSYGRDAVLRAAAEEATRQLSPALLETIVQRGERPTDDMISLLWAAGRETFLDWSADDVLANTTFLFEAGSETTSMLICSMTRRLLWESPERRSAILAEDAAMRWFMEEVLRHSTVVHWRARRATQDVELGGVTILDGDMVHPVNGAANRDPAYWERPDEFDPGRARLASHLAFNVGPRHCAGAHLARLQALETVRALWRAFPDLDLDPAAPMPIFAGYVTRAWRPLHIRFTPRSEVDVRASVLGAGLRSRRVWLGGRAEGGQRGASSTIRPPSDHSAR